MKHTLRWFEERVGKRVYRKGGTCCCHHCLNALDKGFIITDKNTHADYIYTCQNELDLEYSDTPFVGKVGRKK